MVRLQGKFILVVAVGCSVGALVAPLKLIAAPVPNKSMPSTSPSVREAARLKYTPPPGWIQHYLPDDRYKIVGGIWPVVSTEMDTYYHRPDSPNMLRQSRDHVIGFASVEEAIEAGYKADPVDPPTDSSTGGGIGGMDMSGLAGGGSADAIPGQTVTLADGASTIKLPIGWQRLLSKTGDIQPQGESHVNHYSIDAFKPTAGRGMVMIYTGVDPSQDMGRYFSVSNIHALIKKRQDRYNSLNNTLDNTGEVSGGLNHLGNVLQNFSSDVSVSSATVGGMRGIHITRKANEFRSAISSFDTGRGQKGYMVIDMSGGAPGVNDILKSFQAR